MTLLEDVFESEADAEVVSFTFHSGSMRALFNALGTEGTWVEPGAMLPVLVRAERKEGGAVE